MSTANGSPRSGAGDEATANAEATMMRTRVATVDEFRRAWADARGRWGSSAPSWLAHPAAVESWIDDARAGGEATFPDGAVLVLDKVGNVRRLPRAERA
jgi:hypothetical protein